MPLQVINTKKKKKTRSVLRTRENYPVCTTVTDGQIVLDLDHNPTGPQHCDPSISLSVSSHLYIGDHHHGWCLLCLCRKHSTQADSQAHRVEELAGKCLVGCPGH